MARNRYDVDESLEERFNVSQLKRLAGYISPYKEKMAGIIILMLTTGALSMMVPIFFQWVMDDYIPAKDMEKILLISMITMLIAGYSAIAQRRKIKTMSVIGQNIVHHIRYDIFSHLQELPFSYYDDRPHGKIQIRVVNYVNSLSDLLSNGIVNAVTDLCNLIFIIIFMLICDVRLTFICLCGLPILVAVIISIKNAQRRAWQIQSNKSSNLNAYIAESINGIRVTQSFVREKEDMKIFSALSGEYHYSWMKAVTYIFALAPSVETISVITMVFIYAFGVRWILVPGEVLSVGTLVAFVSYISRFWTPINTLTSFYNSLITAISYLERIFETIDEPVLVKDAPDAYEMPTIRGDIRFEDVSFCYEEGHNILEHISFKVRAGEMYAIVGPTGAGKSTIVNLISRFYNLNSGKIYIDDVDILEVTIRSLRKQMGIMMQDSFVFAGTIMDNIRYGNQEATDEQVIEAAKIVCADEFIQNMENGYFTEVSERGSRLSVGQRQLISFARALLTDPKILILDESTSSIDTETELLLQKGLKKLLEGRTSFIIAHRLSTIQNADCILYVDKGRILESGTHEELVEQRGEYYRLYMSQFDL